MASMDDNVADFCAITAATPQQAAQYLRLTENSLEQAIQLFFDSPNLDVSEDQPAAPPAQGAAASARNPIEIDSDDDMEDEDFQEVGSRPSAPPQRAVEDDEAMARRLQEEMYGDSMESEVRAPMARTTETLVGPGAAMSESEIDAIVSDRIARRRPAAPTDRAGIFNQQARGAPPTVWDESADSSARRRELATATGGASEANSKSNMLAQMYRPPFEIMFQRPWDEARDTGKEQMKWIIVNIQDPAIFDCQILNRDIWKNEDIKATVRENFIFMQYAKNDPRGQQYINYYFQTKDDPEAYPHIAVVDPRTGEQVKVWSGPPVPNPIEFHAELHEFLDRYSLKANAKNPVAVRKPDRKKPDVSRMTEDEMLEMALQASLNNAKLPKDEDPDALTKDSGKGKARAEEPVEEEDSANGADSLFATISDGSPHTEPASTDPKITTRIKFTFSGQQKVRKFNVSDPVRTIYEWIKSGGWEGKEGVDFDLIYMRKNLIDSLDTTIEQAGLKGGVVNVEFAE